MVRDWIVRQRGPQRLVVVRGQRSVRPATLPMRARREGRRATHMPNAVRGAWRRGARVERRSHAETPSLRFSKSCDLFELDAAFTRGEMVPATLMPNGPSDVGVIPRGVARECRDPADKYRSYGLPSKYEAHGHGHVSQVDSIARQRDEAPDSLSRQVAVVAKIEAHARARREKSDGASADVEPRSLQGLRRQAFKPLLVGGVEQPDPAGNK